MATRVSRQDQGVKADQQTVNRLYNQLEMDIMWIAESADPETKCMVYDICDHVAREAHLNVIQGQAPGSFRRTFEKLKKTMIG